MACRSGPSLRIAWVPLRTFQKDPKFKAKATNRGRLGFDGE
jgi:hypothetical protein